MLFINTENIFLSIHLGLRIGFGSNVESGVPKTYNSHTDNQSDFCKVNLTASPLFPEQLCSYILAIPFKVPQSSQKNVPGILTLTNKGTIRPFMKSVLLKTFTLSILNDPYKQTTIHGLFSLVVSVHDCALPFPFIFPSLALLATLLFTVVDQKIGLF